MLYQFTRVVIATQHLITGPLSLTKCKVFEATVVYFSYKNKLIKDSQHGFRKGRSCFDKSLAACCRGHVSTDRQKNFIGKNISRLVIGYIKVSNGLTGLSTRALAILDIYK